MISRTYLISWLMTRACFLLHDLVLGALMRAPQVTLLQPASQLSRSLLVLVWQRFFDTTPYGRIVNRAAKDQAINATGQWPGRPAWPHLHCRTWPMHS